MGTGRGYRGRGNKMKVLYTSDLHGHIGLYQELIKLSSSSLTEMIIIGGDLLPSLPATKRYEDMIPNQKLFIKEFLHPLFKRIFDETSVRKIFLTAGNWDICYRFIFKESIEGLIDLNQKCYKLNNGYELIGYPFIPPTPFRPKDYEKMDDNEAPWPPQKRPSYITSYEQLDQLIPIEPYKYFREKETIKEDLDKLIKPSDFKKTIYVMHSPPFGTQLDFIQGGNQGGSKSIKAFIEIHQPILTLHGHIHESPELSGSYIDRIGETLSINPGQFIIEQKLHAVIFDIENIEGTISHTCF